MTSRTTNRSTGRTSMPPRSSPSHSGRVRSCGIPSNTPPRRHQQGGPSYNPSTPLLLKENNENIDTTDINNFIKLIESTKPDQWQRRSDAFNNLVMKIPDDFVVDLNNTPDGKNWYTSPKTLRHLTYPISVLIKDARSSVVKRVCASLEILFTRCNVLTKLLLKDIFPVFLDIHGQTVAVIRTYVSNLIQEILPQIPCKSIIPDLLHRLKSSNEKSRTVREACATYIIIGIENWNSNGYLSEVAMKEIGLTFIKTLRDPSPSVREHTRKGLATILRYYPNVWTEYIMTSQQVSKEPKLKRFLLKLESQQNGDTGIADDLSIAESSIATSRSIRSARNAYYKSQRLAANKNTAEENIPTELTFGTINESKKTSTRSRVGGGGLGPPMRVINNSSSELQPPRRQQQQQQQQQQPFDSIFRNNENNPLSPGEVSVLTQTFSRDENDDNHDLDRRVSNDGRVSSSNEDDNGAFVPTAATSINIDTDILKDADEGPFIGSFNELKKHAKAKTRKSRRSIMLQEKYRKSIISSSTSLLYSGDSNHDSNNEANGTNHLGDQQLVNENGATTSKKEEESDTIAEFPKESSLTSETATGITSTEQQTNNGTPEHIQIAQQLLDIHRNNIDVIMETLRIEMDAMKNFENLLQTNTLSEDDLLTYFESVALCLDQRTNAGKTLHKQMDNIC